MSKGNEFEWLVAKTLSQWINPENKKRTELVRSISSGGWAGRQVPQVGDLAPGGEAGFTFRQHFCVECKHWKEIDWWWYFTASNNDLLLYWKRTLREAARFDLLPLYIVRRNFRPIMVGFPDYYDAPPGSSVMWLRDWDMKVTTLGHFIAVPVRWYYDNWAPTGWRGHTTLPDIPGHA